MIISYHLKTESCDEYDNIREFDSAAELLENLTSNIDMYMPLCSYSFDILNGSEEDFGEVEDVFQEFYKLTWNFEG